jgi:hypothetical protein
MQTLVTVVAMKDIADTVLNTPSLTAGEKNIRGLNKEKIT